MSKILIASAFSAALLATTALHAQSVSVDTGGEAGVSADVGTGDAGVGVDAGASANVGTSGATVGADGDASVGVGTGGTEAGAEAGTGVGADVGTGSGTGAGTDAEADAQIGTTVDTQVETGATATGTSSAAASLTDIGIPTDGFFADETMTELSTEADIRAAFDALSAEQQAQLDAECMEISMTGSPNSALAELCAAIEPDTL